MTEQTKRPPCPISLKIAAGVCLIEVLAAPLIAITTANVTLLAPYVLLYGIIGLICVAGFWYMKRWSLPSYIGLIGVNHMVVAKMGAWNPALLVLPVVVILLAGINYSKMD